MLIDPHEEERSISNEGEVLQFYIKLSNQIGLVAGDG